MIVKIKFDAILIYINKTISTTRALYSRQNFYLDADFLLVFPFTSILYYFLHFLIRGNIGNILKQLIHGIGCNWHTEERINIFFHKSISTLGGRHRCWNFKEKWGMWHCTIVPPFVVHTFFSPKTFFFC